MVRGIGITIWSNAPALVSNMAASAFSWVGGLRQQEAEPPPEENAYVYNSEIGVRAAASSLPRLHAAPPPGAGSAGARLPHGRSCRSPAGTVSRCYSPWSSERPG